MVSSNQIDLFVCSPQQITISLSSTTDHCFPLFTDFNQIDLKIQEGYKQERLLTDEIGKSGSLSSTATELVYCKSNRTL